MKRRMLSLLLIAVVMLGMLPTTVLAALAQNGGIYQISTAEDLLWFAQEVNAGGTGIKGMLTADIDLSDVSDWPGIGTTSNPFTLTFVDGFKAGSNFKVVAQQILSQDLIDNGYTPEEIQLTGKDGTYTIPTVQKDYRIIVSGVEAVSRGITATVSFTITEGHYQFHIDPKNDHLMLDRTFTVPYFDLSLYGLERYYYNPYCYVDEDGNLRGIQQKGTPRNGL